MTHAPRAAAMPAPRRPSAIRVPPGRSPARFRLARLPALFLLALAAAPSGAAPAQAGAGGEPGGPPRDPDFGVVARGAIGLERRVRMYQWQRDGGNGYRKAWSERAIDSTRFLPGHENPDAMPLRSRRWLPGTVRLDGRPVAPEAVETLARWEPFRPDFSALPGNLSATFQPEGDGLGSAANPARPEVGDLRVTWRALRMPATREPLVLRDGQWELRDPAAALRAGAAGRGEAGPRADWKFGWTAAGVLAGVLFAGLLVLRRRRRR